MHTFIRHSGSVIISISLLAACGAEASSSGADDVGTVDPLSELMGWNIQESPAEQRAMQLQSEEAVQTCMRAEGFEYTPVDYEAQFGNGGDEDAELYQDPKAFGEKYGYGVVHGYEQWEEPYLNGDGEGGFDGPVFEDPNQEYVDSLSEREREDYYTLLHGDQSNFEEASEDGLIEAPPIEEQGCYGKAQAEVYGDRFQIDPEIEARLNDYFSSTIDDPDLAAANEDWKACMIDDDPDVFESDVEGFTVKTPDQMYQLMDFEKSAAMGMRISDYESDDSGGSGYSSDGDQKPIPDDELEALRARELALWKVDRDCQEEADIPGIQRRVQQRIVDELRADFPELANSDS